MLKHILLRNETVLERCRSEGHHRISSSAQVHIGMGWAHHEKRVETSYQTGNEMAYDWKEQWRI